MGNRRHASRRQPAGALDRALLEADLYDRTAEHARENLLATLSRSHFGLVEAVKQADVDEGTNFLLVVDQFEEIFRFHEAGQMQQEDANEFVSLLLEAAAQNGSADLRRADHAFGLHRRVRAV